MKLREYYINKYREQKKELVEKGELWRLCVKTEEEFTDKLDNIFVETLVFNFINDFHRETTIKGKINLLLQQKKSEEEIKEYIKKSEKETEEADKKAIPIVKLQLKSITSPLSWENIVRISKWISRKQINFQELDEDIQNDFKKTKQYQHLKINNKL